MDQQAQHAIAADQPLPSAVVGNSGTWGSRANQYPVFSQSWFRYRARFYCIPIAVLTVILLASVFFIPADSLTRPFSYIALISTWLMVVTSLLLGRWLAVRIRLQGWPEKKEAKGIMLALAFGICVALVFSWYASGRHIPHAQEAIDQEQKIKHPLDNDADPKVIARKKETKEKEKLADVVNTIIWVMLLAWWGGSFDLVAYFRQRRALKDALLQKEIDHYKKDRNEAELRLSVLASQVEPHFLFNTLSGVRSAILSDPARGVAIIDHLVEYLRATIPQMRSDGSCAQATLKAQLDSIRAYLGVIHFRIPRLSFNVECDSALDDLTIPPLMLISLVENAVKHGVEPKKGSAHILVIAKKVLEGRNERLLLTVSDDGAGFSGDSSGSGIGLANIHERLKQLYGHQAALTLHTNEEGGVDARISLPLQHE